MTQQNDATLRFQPLLLVRNVTCPTHQLHALAGSKQTLPQTTLKIAILKTMQWLRRRFRAFELPAEFNMPPAFFQRKGLHKPRLRCGFCRVYGF